MKSKLVILFIAVLPIISCNVNGPCGTFNFTGVLIDDAFDNGLDISLRFDFNPNGCGLDCTCDTVCFIQMARIIDLNDGTFLYPSSETSARKTDEGWYVDRRSGRNWGYYGRNNDGTFDSTVDIGSELVPAILRDEPTRNEEEPWLGFKWEAVSVALCIEEDSDCANKLLYSYHWGFTVDDDGSVTKFNNIAEEELRPVVVEAVEKWNVQASVPGSDQIQFPDFTWH